MKKVFKSALIVIFCLVFLANIGLSGGCSSGIEIVVSEKQTLNKEQRKIISDDLINNNNLGNIKFQNDNEERAFFFALQLYYSQEYYRAITEYMRFVSYFKNSELIPVAYFLVGECYRSSNKYNEAIFFYTKAKEIDRELTKYDFSWLAEYNIALCLIFQKDYKQAIKQLNIFNETIQSRENNKLPKFLNGFLKLILLVANKEYSDAGKIISTMDKQLLLEFTGIQIDEDDFIKFKELPSRNVGLSVIMSTLVPGLGQLYTNRPIEALTSILLTGLFTFIAYEAFTENQDILGAISSFLATSFYLANIYNAANSAIAFNENRRVEFYNRLMNKLDSDVLHFFLIPEEAETGLTFSFRVLR